MKQITPTNSSSKILVDDEDYPVLSRLTWYVSDTGYAITDTPVKHIKMHKLLTGAIPRGAVIDHINRNKLDNRKENLRVVSQKINVTNSTRYENAKHYWLDKRRNQWIVEMAGIKKYIPVESPTMAERVVRRIKFGFPVDKAIEEAHNPTICITNWKRHNINYETYLQATRLGVSLKEYRRRNGKKSKRGKAKK